MYTIKKILKAIIILIIALWIAFFGIIIYAVITDYKPDKEEIISSSQTPSKISDSLLITVLTWNIGYCGLDDSMDFFYDGGTKVITPHDRFEQNYEAISAFLKSNDTLNFMLLQEVDRNSKRSYRLDEYNAIEEKLDYNSSQFAANYKVFFVPVPTSQPMGKVYSGITISGQYVPSLSVRYAFPGKYSFPKQLFMLDRCFLVNRYPLSNGRELVLINTHNEAFDPGEIRKAQMDYLENFITGEFKKGNYVIAGGDWNQSPPGFQPEFKHNQVNIKQMAIEPGFLRAGWTWAYDNTVPSNRSVTAPYYPANTITTVIDFFVLSPNIESVSVKCIDLDFKNSDHNPVILKAKLK